MKKKSDMTAGMALFVLAMVLGFVIGWVMNIIAICHAHEFSGMVIARVIGVFVAPVGGVLGYF